MAWVSARMFPDVDPPVWPFKVDQVYLDELQQETEKLLGLLQDRQPGLISWNAFVNERLEKLHMLASQGLGK